ncbi:hypothetical protein EDB84DRAFT_1441457 [Lactarius hengduanensis]|nr:hypothetical protein EDB84DRAFT_1441457 [Lactarius hengduanensis]
MSSESENAPNSPKPAIVSKSSEHIYHWSKDPISHEEAIAIENIHEATLRELLRARNLAVSQLLLERNQLLRERVDLGAEPVSYCEYDFLSQPASPRPYRISAWGQVLRYHSDRPHRHATTFPKDRRLFDQSVQTDGDPVEADTTLTEVDTSTLTKPCTKRKEVDQDAGETDHDARNKKRKREI